MTSNASRPIPRLLDRISFLVHRINAHLLREMNPRLKIWGIDLTESRLLVALHDIGPQTAGELVRVMALPQSTVSHQVKRLEKRGYVTRETDKKDTRVVIMRLTESGRDIALQAERTSREVTQRFAQAIGDDDEVSMVRAALKRIDNTLSRAS